MRILNTYSQNSLYYSKQPAFKGRAIPMSATEIAKLPAHVKARIQAAQLEQVAKGASEPEQKILAGVIPRIIAPVKNALAIARQHKGIPVLDSTHQKLAVALEELEQAQQVLPKADGESAEHSVQSRFKAMLAKRSDSYQTLCQTLEAEDCTVESAKAILDKNLLKSVRPRDHRFELVEKMLGFAVKKKSPEIVNGLFNYVFDTKPRSGFACFRIAKNLPENTPLLPTLKKFFDAAIETEDDKFVKKTYCTYMQKNKTFDNDINNKAIDFALNKDNEELTTEVIEWTGEHAETAEFDKKKMTTLLKKYLTAQFGYGDFYMENKTDTRTAVRVLLSRLPQATVRNIRTHINAELKRTKTDADALTNQLGNVRDFFALNQRN